MQAFEIRCHQRLLDFSYKNNVTNENVCRKIQAITGENDELLTTEVMVQKWKLRWYSHISRSSGLAKIFLQCTLKGNRRRAILKKRLEYNIREWTGMNFCQLN